MPTSFPTGEGSNQILFRFLVSKGYVEDQAEGGRGLNEKSRLEEN